MAVELILNDSGTGAARGWCSADFGAAYLCAANGQTMTLTVRVKCDRAMSDFRLTLYSAATGLGFAETAAASVAANTETTLSLTLTVTHAENAFSTGSARTAATFVKAAAMGIVSTVGCVTPVTALRYRLSPAIDFSGLIRCGSDGTASDEGTCVRVGRLKLLPREEWQGTAADLTVRGITITASGVSRSLSIPESVLTAALSADGYTETAPSLFTGVTFAASESYTVRAEIGSADHTSEVEVVLPAAFANMHLSGCSTGGVAFGGFSNAQENAPRFECWYPAYFYGGSALSGIRARPDLRQNVSVANNTDTVVLTYTVTEAGTYIIIGQARFGANSSGRRVVCLRVSDADGSNEKVIARESMPPCASFVTQLNLSAAHTFSAGQKIELVVNQSSGGALNVQGNAAGEYTHMTLVRLI